MICLLPLYALVAVTAAQGVGTPTHTIVLDAGKTITQLKIYKETVVHSKDGPGTTVKLIFSKSFSPGMGEVFGDPEKLKDHISTIMLEARAQIVSAYYEWTTLYMMANSDLRFLPVEDMEQLLQQCRDLLSNNPTLNPFQFETSNVQLLAGEDEGILTWLSANYLRGAFSKIRYQNETVGILDMGNSSTEITFVPDEPLYAEKYPTLFRNKRHDLYTQNYLQYGAESIYVKIHNVLTTRDGNKTRPINPCLLKGHTKKIQLSDGTFTEHLGSGDPDLCEDILVSIVKPNTGDDCQPKPCAIRSVYQPHIKDVQFMATVGFVYTPTALGVVDETKTLYLDLLKQAAYNYCKKTVDQVIADYEKDDDSASQDCMMGIYIPTLFHVAYGFSMDTKQIKLAPDYEGEPIDWSHGFVVYIRNL